MTNIFGNNAAGTAKSLIAVQPDLTGNFKFSILNGAFVTIEKDILGTTDVQPVVNGFDALLTRRVLLNDATLTPSVYQMVAMDVNTDGFISAGDVSQINQRAVLMIPEFKQSWNYNNQGVSNGKPSKDWLFVDSTKVNTDLAYKISTTYPANDGVGFSKSRVPVIPFNLSVPVTGSDCPSISSETFKGILIGDVNGNFATVSPVSMFKQAPSDKVIFDIENAVAANGFIEVPVSISSDKGVNALDFAVEIAEGNLSYNSIVDHTNKFQSLAYFNTEDQTLRFTSNSIENYDVNKKLVSVRFSTTSSKINLSDLTSLRGYLNGEPVSVETSQLATGISENNFDKLISVYPNPANNVLNVEVTEDATAQLFDVNGKQVIADVTVNAYQKQALNIQHVAKGVYSLRVSNDKFVTIKKIVIN